VLGVGGVRCSQALGEKIDVYHFNEGHAVFAGSSCCARDVRRHDAAERLARLRPHVVFTTHTPVPAGNEVHDLDACARSTPTSASPMPSSS
jgi:starch phosphorylase